VDLKEEAILGDGIARHWYYQSKARALVRLIARRVPRKILDIGSGSGFFSRYLLEHTAAAEALCVDTSYLADRDETVGAKPIQFRRACGPVDAALVLMMDVLEHVDDDVGLVAEYAAKVPSGTSFLITVPAFSFLWSDHDVFLEHRRRYTVPRVEQVMKKAGLEVEQACYFFGFIFPLVTVVRLTGNLLRDKLAPPRSHLQKHSPLAHGILSGVCRLELPFLPFNRLAGLSVFCLARKP
jgi:SAM-dependent methyltransferase